MKLKKLICLLTALVICLSIAVLPASARSSCKTVTDFRGRTKSVTVVLSNRRRDAQVNISSQSGAAINVKMYTTSGRYIWGQNRAIACFGNRTFRLGCDHSAYVIKVNTYVSGRTMNVYFRCYDNCYIK